MFDFNKEPGRKIRKNKFENIKLKEQRDILITVITPYYNAGKYIEQTYRCMVNQTFPWFEWLIVDDGSTNEKDLFILEKLRVKDSRISIIRREENGGIAAARNTGIRMAVADILVMVDADDLIVPTYLEVLYWLLYKNPDCDWAYTNAVGFQDKQYLWNQPFDMERLKRYNFLTYSAAIRKKALQEVGGYDDSEKYYYEDWYLWLRLLKKGKKPVKSSLYGFWYRRQETGVLGTINNNKRLHHHALKLIHQIAENIEVNISAKEFPCSPTVNEFSSLSVEKWNQEPLKGTGQYRILFLIPWMRMGGSEIFELEILKRIDKKRFEITIATTIDTPLEWRQKFEEYTEDIFELPSFLEMRDYPEFISYLIQSRGICLVLITNSYYGYYLMPWLRIQFPALAIIDYVHMEEWYWRRGGYARISSYMKEISEHTYVCSEHTRQVLMKDFGRNGTDISTLYIGVDVNWFDPSVIKKRQCYEKLGIPKGKKIVLFPCRMDYQKRPFLMLEIAKEAKRRKMDIVFVAVGDGALLQQLKNTCIREKLQKMVFFVGKVEDVRPYYKDASVTLNCSIQEGIALTTFESCSMGVPVISADVGGQKEVIDESVGKLLPIFQDGREFGKNVYIKSEICQYVDAIEEILGDTKKYKMLCENCRKKIKDKFNIQTMVKRIEDIFCYYIENKEILLLRKEKAGLLSNFSSMAEELITLYCEMEGRDSMYKDEVLVDNKDELIRIAESKWGRKLIKIFFHLRLNRIWK